MGAIFWLSLGVVFYAWVGYPLLLALIVRGRARVPAPPGPSPTVSVIIAAYNEAQVIEEKIQSTLAQRYPSDRLEVIVVSDASTDDTDAIVRTHPDPRVGLVRRHTRAGKSVALNRGVAASRGEILVFTDADAIFAADAVARLVAGFDDPRVALVSGQGFYAGRAGGDAPAIGNGYARFESFLKRRESALGFVAAADGAIYALRRTAYRALRAREVNDLLHPIQVALGGGLSRFEPRAVSVEPPSAGAAQEFRRHVRIIAQGFHIVADWLPRLLAARCWRQAWMLVSHRLARWTTAWWLLVALASNVALVERGGIYVPILVAQGGFYGLALAGALAERCGRSPRLLALPHYFCVVSVAGMIGLVRFMRGGTQATWSPRGARPGSGPRGTATRERAA